MPQLFIHKHNFVMTTPAPALSLQNVTVQFGQHTALADITTTIPQGVLLAIAGPNGAGKSTLLQSCIGLLKPNSGTISLLGDSFEHNRLKIAYIPQRAHIDWDFPASVRDVVLMGRYGHVGWLRRLGTKDYQAADSALIQVGMQMHADAHIGSLSGGQQQRVLIARALAQNAQLYMMDEPFIGVDVPTEQSLFEILKRLVYSGKTVVIVHHDILTIPNFDWVWFLNKRSIACGPVQTTFTADNVGATYGKMPSYISFG